MDQAVTLTAAAINADDDAVQSTLIPTSTRTAIQTAIQTTTTTTKSINLCIVQFNHYGPNK